MAHPFGLFLFSTDTHSIEQASRAGIEGIIVDCENRGKAQRQNGYNTQINYATMEDLRRVRSCTNRTVICRINGFGETTEQEVEAVIASGADELLLPMVRHSYEVLTVLNQVQERCRVGIMVETADAACRIDELARLPLSRIYIGLNDLSIDRRLPNIFASLADGSVERICTACSMPVGFAALTVPEGGAPIPCRLLMGELARLDCSFSILRRAFFADTVGRDMQVEIARIQEAMEQARQRPPHLVAQEREELLKAIQIFPRPLYTAIQRACPQPSLSVA